MRCRRCWKIRSNSFGRWRNEFVVLLLVLFSDLVKNFARQEEKIRAKRKFRCFASIVRPLLRDEIVDLSQNQLVQIVENFLNGTAMFLHLPPIVPSLYRPVVVRLVSPMVRMMKFHFESNEFENFVLRKNFFMSIEKIVSLYLRSIVAFFPPDVQKARQNVVGETENVLRHVEEKLRRPRI